MRLVLGLVVNEVEDLGPGQDISAKGTCLDMRVDGIENKYKM